MKALRAVQYTRNANRDFQLTDIRQLTSELEQDDSIMRWTSELHRLIGSTNRLLYPTEHTAMNIPHDVITTETCEAARALCSSIVQWCKTFVNNGQQ